VSVERYDAFKVDCGLCIGYREANTKYGVPCSDNSAARHYWLGRQLLARCASVIPMTRIATCRAAHATESVIPLAYVMPPGYYTGDLSYRSDRPE